MQVVAGALTSFMRSAVVDLTSILISFLSNNLAL